MVWVRRSAWCAALAPLLLLRTASGAATTVAPSVEGEHEGTWETTVDEGDAVAVEGAANAETLRFVQVLFRHGDRTPARTFPSDTGNTESTWPEGWGELTTVGMSQQFRLGQYLRKRYDKFLGDKYERASVYVRSSDYNRTLMSASANLAGLFPPSKDEQFAADVRWRPIPIHTVRVDEDVQLYEEVRCPTAEKALDELFLSHPHAKELERKYAGVLSDLSNRTGLSRMRLRDMWTVFDPLNSEFCHREAHAWPAWMNETYWETIKFLYDASSRFIFRSNVLRRLRGGPLVHEVIDRFTSKTVGELQKMKMYIYSAHDTTLAAILATLGVFPQVFPLYATAIMIELHEREGEYYVEMYHKNATDVDALYRHRMEGCDNPCKLRELKQAMIPYEPTDWRSECGLETVTSGREWRYILAIVVLVVTSLILLVLLILDVLFRKEIKKVVNNRRSQQQEGEGGGGDSERLLQATEEDEEEERGGALVRT